MLNLNMSKPTMFRISTLLIFFVSIYACNTKISEQKPSFSIKSQTCFDNSYLAPRIFELNDSLHRIYKDTVTKSPADSIANLLSSNENQDISEYPLWEVLVPNANINSDNQITFPNGAIIGFVLPEDTSLLSLHLTQGVKMGLFPSNIRFEYKPSMRLGSYLAITGFNKHIVSEPINSDHFNFSFKRSDVVKNSSTVNAMFQKIAKIDRYILYMSIKNELFQKSSETLKQFFSILIHLKQL